MRFTGTKFTSFTGTRVQKLTQKALLDDYLYALYTNSIRTSAAGGNREGNVVGRGKTDAAGATEAAAKATAGKVPPAAPQSDAQHDHHEEL